MTRPHTGVGSDGLLVVQPSSRAPLRMRVFNSDGSEAEISGNGLRLFAKFVLDRRWAELEGDALRVETGAGLRTVWPSFAEPGPDDDGSRGKMHSGRIAMGAPVFEARDIPVDDSRPEWVGGQPPRVRLTVAGRTLDLVCLSLGNPHAVAILDEPVADFPLADVGPEIQTHPLFPNRVNFEIANAIDRSRLRARIFERGEGETLSSGTGSTACAVAARALGRTDDRVAIELPGGVLRVAWDGRGEAMLEGPVAEVFRGRWNGPGPSASADGSRGEAP